MNRTTLYLATLCLLLAATSVYIYKRAAGEIHRLQQNQEALLQNGDVRIGQTPEKHNFASVPQLTLRLSEFRRSNDSLLQVVRELKIKSRRLQALTSAAAHTAISVNTPLRDSIVTISGQTDTLPCLHHSDPWITLDGCISDSRFLGVIESRDTLIHVLHRIPRKFLFFRFGTKAVRLEVLSRNPHTKITHARYINLTK